VVAHAPDLIAVYSDLSTGGEPYPVVKVLRHPLDRMTGGRPPLGTRLATVALFRGAPNRPRWIDFTPIAVNCASSDTAAIERVVAGIRQREWQAMEEALRQVPTPYRPGVYPVKLPPHLIWT